MIDSDEDKWQGHNGNKYEEKKSSALCFKAI